MRRHFERCGACALFYQEEATLARELERLPLAEPASDMWSRVATGLNAPEMQPSRARRFDWGRRPVAAFITGLAVTAGLIAFTQFQPAPPASPPVSIVKESYLRQPIPAPSQDVNPEVDDPLADQMNNLFAAVDQMTKPEETP
ncbi:MAG: hypothetical protein KY468_20800 [Armatimonadetes bacterium]|nr:hypothetical protein [Armatimonadota bacterium]